MYKTFIYAGIAVICLLMVYSAIAGPTFPVASSTLTSTDLEASRIINNVSAKLIEVSPIESAIPAIGDSEFNAAIASSISDLSRINTMMMKSNWKYVTEIFESQSDALQPGTYKVELFENGKTKGALYFKQDLVNPEMNEGVMAAWDIGNDLPLNAIYTVKVTQCPCT